jgi:putative ABC transport system permease protein
MGPIEIEGQPVVEGPSAPRAETLSVAPDYLEVMGLRVTNGRSLQPQDRRGGELVALVTDDFASRYVPGQSPLGRRFRSRAKTPGPWRTIVGTVPSIGNPAGIDREYNAAVIVPFDQRPSRRVELVVAAVAGADAPTGAVRRAVARIDPALVIDRFTTVKDRYAERTWPVRVFGGLFSAFGVIAMLLASAGLYAVMAFAVRRRTAEIGIRMALGADRSRVLWMMVRNGMSMVAVGLALGAGLGFLLSSQLTQLLSRVSPWDMPVVLTTALVLVVSGLAASAVPARSAAAVDPLVALRSD